MSWDVMAFSFDGERPPPIDQLNETTLRSMGRTQDVREKITHFLPGVDWSSPSWGTYLGAGFTFESNVGEDEEETKSFMIHVRGGGDAVAALMQMAIPNRWALLDCSTCEFIDPANPSNSSWKAFQKFRDRIVASAPDEIRYPSQPPTQVKPWWRWW